MKFAWYSKVKYIEYDFADDSNKDLYSFFDEPDQLIHLAWGACLMLRVWRIWK